MLTVSIQNVNDVAILKCRGRLVRGEEKSLLCAAAWLPQQVILDMSEVEAIDAGGIGLLVSLQAAGIYLTLLNPTEPVRDVLRLTEVDSIVQICESQSPGELVAARIVPGTNVCDQAEAVPLAG